MLSRLRDKEGAKALAKPISPSEKG